MRGSSFTWLSTGSCLSSSPLQGSQKILIWSEITKCASAIKYIFDVLFYDGIFHCISDHLKGLTPPLFRSFFADSVVVVGASFSSFSSTVSSSSTSSSSGACSTGFDVVDCALWKGNEKKKEIYFVYDWDIEFISIFSCA